MPVSIRLATPDDASAIRSIYAPFVQSSTVSFELTVPSIPEMARRIARGLETLPWVICTRDDEMLGYAYAAEHRSREAYQWCVESTVYVAEHARRQCVGRALYASLFEVLRLQGFVNVYAGIALPNPASVAMHETCGFAPVGVYPGIGHKSGKWHDVGWWQLRLTAEVRSDPAEPKRLSEIRGDSKWKATLEFGTALLDESST